MGGNSHCIVEYFKKEKEPLICSSKEQVFAGDGISFFTGTSFMAAKAKINRFFYLCEPQNQKINVEHSMIIITVIEKVVKCGAQGCKCPLFHFSYFADHIF